MATKQDCPQTESPKTATIQNQEAADDVQTSACSDASFEASSCLNPEHPRFLIPKLCKQFYKLGWVTGTGGGISIKYGNEIYIAPSGVQKERIKPEDLFVMTATRPPKLISSPKNPKLKPSQCTPLFYNAFMMREAGACIHTHSQHAVIVTLLYDKEFRITHQEMIKGFVSHSI
jgi:methylthioribulose-1-phosphate dehydratase